ncbi:EF hand domain-containing protein [Caballeronia peredens]|nr:EF hand domain-containing protein [Caballeronia peredens]
MPSLRARALNCSVRSLDHYVDHGKRYSQSIKDASSRPRIPTGWVRLDEFDARIDPNPLDSVVLLNEPFAVKAGDVIGYLGEYQNYSDAQILPPKPSRPILHVEVFAGDTFRAFVERSRERAKMLPSTQRSMMMIRQGVKLVAPADGDLSVPAIERSYDRVWVRFRAKISCANCD